MNIRSRMVVYVSARVLGLELYIDLLNNGQLIVKIHLRMPGRKSRGTEKLISLYINETLYMQLIGQQMSPESLSFISHTRL